MKPMVHARISAKKFGGQPSDYLDIHQWFDSTKAALPDVRHRMILHNAFGCFLAEQVFGHTLTNSDGRVVHVRDVAEAHVIEDLGFIPTIERCLRGMAIEPWMSGGVQRFAEDSKPQPAQVYFDKAPGDLRGEITTLPVTTINTPVPGTPPTIID